MKSERHSYSIHDILTLESAVALPELEAFRTDCASPDPTIRVELGGVRDHDETGRQRTVTYTERTGWRGFAIRLELGQRTRIIASPFLGKSPHVLYTNAVEPVLRWAFVERGFALVHGACLASKGDAFIITARTDTGKTTTILKTLDAHPEYAFLSDDLTLLNEAGTVLSYPKPLTISRHTLHAVNTPLLSRLERFALFFQSRLHSKSGRSFGLILTQFNLPMATINAVVQRVVPPPKYRIQRLVPHTRVSQNASLKGLVVIERGKNCEIRLDPHEAVEVLLANCEDSYGFPPYSDIKEFLYLTRRQDLREEERRIVSAALSAHPAIVLRSETRTWFQQIPAFISRATRPIVRFEPADVRILEQVGD